MMPNLARVWQYEEEGKRIFSFPFFVVLLRFFFITITKVKHQLRHNFIFTFSSTSRKESINFNTFSHFFLQRFFSYLMRACERQGRVNVFKIFNFVIRRHFLQKFSVHYWRPVNFGAKVNIIF